MDFSLQKEIKRKFARPRVIVSGIDSQWDVDIGSTCYRYIFKVYRALINRAAEDATKEMESILVEGRKIIIK